MRPYILGNALPVIVPVPVPLPEEVRCWSPLWVQLLWTVEFAPHVHGTADGHALDRARARARARLRGERPKIWGQALRHKAPS